MPAMSATKDCVCPRLRSQSVPHRFFGASVCLAVLVFLYFSSRSPFLSISRLDLSSSSIHESLDVPDWIIAKRPNERPAQNIHNAIHDASLIGDSQTDQSPIPTTGFWGRGSKSYRQWKHGQISDLPRPQQKSRALNHTDAHSVEPHCNKIAGAENIFVTMRTGATSAQARLPVHYHTTLRCMPHHVVYSDLAETVAGHHVGDALSHLNSTYLTDHEQLKFYRMQQKVRSETPQRPMASLIGEPPPDSVKEDGEAWQLDKFKFFPLLEQALQHRPGAHWFVFLEDDTYPVWSYLVPLLQNKYDHLQPLYLGSEHIFNQGHAFQDVSFAQGGAGFVLSNTALRMAAGEYRRHRAAWDELITRIECGDAAVGLLMEEMGIPVTDVGSMLQGQSVGEVEWVDWRWCRPAASFSHLAEPEITVFADFERRWVGRFGSRKGPANSVSVAHKPLRHRNVFAEMAWPVVRRGKVAGWDNFSEGRVLTESTADIRREEIQATQSEDGCERVCERDEQCLQWRYVPGSCSIGYALKRGEAVSTTKAKQGLKPSADVDGTTSGWIVERVEGLFEQWNAQC